MQRSAIPWLVAGSFFMENLDGTIIVTALPAMARAFHTSVTSMSLGVLVYLLALAIFIPASGWVADRFGARRVFAFAIALFTLSSVACAASSNLPAFTLARLIQGMAGAMMVPVGRLAVLRNTPKEGLIDAIATITWPGLAAPILGPAAGGFIVTHSSWDRIFWLNVPLGIAGFVIALRLIPETPPSERLRKPFDITGFLLTGAAGALLMGGVEWVSQGRALAIGAALLLVGLAAGFAAYAHARRRPHPMLDPSAFSIPTFAITVASGSAFRAALFAMPFLLPLLLQLVFGLNAFHAGLLVLALFAGNLAMKPFTGPILRRVTFRNVLLYNSLITTATFWAAALLTATTPVAVSVVLFFIAGLTRSMQFTAYATLAFADVPPEQMSGANTLFNTLSQLAAGLGVAAGALALRAASYFFEGSVSASTPSLLDFRFAFAVMGVVCVVSILEVLRLKPDAGDAVRPR